MADLAVRQGTRLQSTDYFLLLLLGEEPVSGTHMLNFIPQMGEH